MKFCTLATLKDLCNYHDWRRFKALRGINDNVSYGTIYKCIPSRVRSDVLCNFNNVSVVEVGSYVYVLVFDRPQPMGYYTIDKVFREGKKKQIPNSYFLNKTYFM